MDFHIRYTCSGEIQAKVVDFVMRNASKYIISREIASREHIQCYVYTNVVKKTWVNKFNLKFKELDRRDKYVDEDRGNTKFYVCKGDDKDTAPDVIAKLGFTDEDIKAFQSQYWSNKNKEEIVKNPELPPMIFVENSSKTKKAKPPTFMKQCRLELEEEYPEKEEWSMADKTIVFKKVMYKLGEGCRNLDHIIISRMTYGILNSLVKNKKEWLEYWFRKSFNEDLNPHDVENDYSLDE